MIDFGRIFVPQEYGMDYCKSPQAIVFDEYVRVYFSYCVSDNEKLISRVAYADFDKAFKNVLDYSKDVIGKSKLGTFDEHGIFPISPFRDGGKIKAITTGWTRRCSVSTDTGLGLVISDNNGKTFSRFGDGPIMTSTLSEPFLVADGFVVKSDNKYYMYYIYGTEWAEYSGAQKPERTYKIALAQSDDLLEWERDGKQIIESSFEGEAQALPSVVYYNGLWHMAFCYRHTVGFRENRDKSYKIGYAFSHDLRKWKRDDSKIKIPEHDWNIDMQCYPNLFIMDDELYLLYNGNHFAKEGFGLLKLEEM